jgi:hypothetical protein
VFVKLAISSRAELIRLRAERGDWRLH